MSSSWLDRAAPIHWQGAYIAYPVCREGEWGRAHQESQYSRGREGVAHQEAPVQRVRGNKV